MHSSMPHDSLEIPPHTLTIFLGSICSSPCSHGFLSSLLGLLHARMVVYLAAVTVLRHMLLEG